MELTNVKEAYWAQTATSRLSVCGGHCFIHRVQGITSLFMRQLTRAKPLKKRGSHNPLCLWASGQHLAGLVQQFTIKCIHRKNLGLFCRVVNRHVGRFSIAKAIIHSPYLSEIMTNTIFLLETKTYFHKQNTLLLNLRHSGNWLLQPYMVWYRAATDDNFHHWWIYRLLSRFINWSFGL